MVLRRDIPNNKFQAPFNKTLISHIRHLHSKKLSHRRASRQLCLHKKIVVHLALMEVSAKMVSVIASHQMEVPSAPRVSKNFLTTFLLTPNIISYHLITLKFNRLTN